MTPDQIRSAYLFVLEKEGWTELHWLTEDYLVGLPKDAPDEQEFQDEPPRYDLDMNLITALVGKLEEADFGKWYYELEGLKLEERKGQKGITKPMMVYCAMVCNASAAEKLVAYAKVKGWEG